MAEDVDNTPAEPEERSGPVAGQRLAEARRELQISVLEIAKELHLDEPKVRALERNEFDVLGAPVFAKGHLRKYAELVNVAVEDVIGDYYDLTRLAEMPPVVSARPKPRRELTPGPWIAVIVVIVVAASAYWWFTRPSTPVPVAEPRDVAPSQPVPADDGETGSDAAADETTGETAPDPEPVAAATETAAPPTPVVEETESPGIAAGQMRLLLTYTGDCWTEVTDATGRRLFFALGTDGRTVELGGAEPFNVLLGSPGNVAVEVNGDTYALPPNARPDRPLRLSVAGS